MNDLVQIVILTGLSGSGKTTALRALEDIGYFCMDNLPIVLLPKVVELATVGSPIARMAVGVDARERQFLKDAVAVINGIAAKVEVVFIEADDGSLLRRFRETRRRHPLAGPGDVKSAIERERELLHDLRARADRVVDSTGLSVHDLKLLMQHAFQGSDVLKLQIKLLSFGFKYGLPPACDLVLDVRFLQNPYFIPTMRHKTGLDSVVREFVLEQDRTQRFLSLTVDLLKFLAPEYVNEGKVYLTVGIGCTGGQHRSVAVAEALKERLSSAHPGIVVAHRERSRWPAQDVK